MLGGCHVTATRWTTGEGRLPEATSAHAAWPTPAQEGLGATVTTAAAVGSRTAVCWQTSPRCPCRRSGSATWIILTKKATTRWGNSSATDSEPAGHWRTADQPRHWYFTCKVTSSISQSSWIPTMIPVGHSYQARYKGKLKENGRGPIPSMIPIIWGPKTWEHCNEFSPGL